MVATKAAVAAVALAFTCMAGTAAAQEAVPAERSARLADVEAAILKAESRRRSAIGSFVAAGVFLVGGIVVSAVQTAKNAEEAEEEAYRNGQTYYEYDTEWAPFVIGTALAVPIAIGGVSTMRDANRERRELLRQRRELKIGARADGTVVVGYSF